MNAPFRPRSVQVTVAGVAALADRSGALFLDRESTLVVSDLHLEKGAAFARRRSMLPPYDTLVTLAKLEEVLACYRPRRVMALGDSFHDRLGSELMPEEFRTRLVSLMEGIDWLWISGNHDPDPPRGLPGEAADEASSCGLTLRHEPSAAREGEIAGHLHPGARVVRRGQSIRRPCFACDGVSLVMPAFGSLTGCLNLMDPAFSGLFSRPKLVAHVTGKDAVYSIPLKGLSAG